MYIQTSLKLCMLFRTDCQTYKMQHSYSSIQTSDCAGGRRWHPASASCPPAIPDSQPFSLETASESGHPQFGAKSHLTWEPWLQHKDSKRCWAQHEIENSKQATLEPILKMSTNQKGIPVMTLGARERSLYKYSIQPTTAL